LSPETLERLGRLFGAFCFLFALLVTPACKSGGAHQPNDKGATAHADMGNQHLSQGDWPEAIKSFGVALEQDEANREALRGMGVAYLKLGKLGEAERYSRRAVEVDPKWSEPKNELATTLIMLERCKEAEDLLQQVLKDIFYQTPWFAEHNLARALRCQDRPQEAMDLLERTVTKQPHFCLGYLTLSEISAQLKKHETTISACDGFRKNCAEHDKIKEQVLPEYRDMCYLRSGLAHAAIGDVESARASFKRCQSEGAFGKECRRTLEMLPP
jgi:Tfp pilus assembly protein PilF